jgi:hypothetical protein
MNIHHRVTENTENGSAGGRLAPRGGIRLGLFSKRKDVSATGPTLLPRLTIVNLVRSEPRKYALYEWYER